MLDRCGVTCSGAGLDGGLLIDVFILNKAFQISPLFVKFVVVLRLNESNDDDDDKSSPNVGSLETLIGL